MSLDPSQEAANGPNVVGRERSLVFASLIVAAAAFGILRSRRVRTLRVAEDQFARHFENTTTGIVVLQVIFDRTGAAAGHEVVDMNPAAQPLLGVTAREGIGMRSGDAAYLQWPEPARAANYRVALTACRPSTNNSDRRPAAGSTSVRSRPDTGSFRNS